MIVADIRAIRRDIDMKKRDLGRIRALAKQKITKSDSCAALNDDLYVFLIFFWPL